MHGTGEASDWIQRFGPLLARGAKVLDVACGAGRHTRWFAARGAVVTALDRDSTALQGLDTVARVVCADIENGPWPLAGETFDAIVITNYLWRPLWPVWLGSLSPNGLLLVETFALGHAKLGRPRNPDFLLRPGELLEIARSAAGASGPGLQVLAYEDGLLDDRARRGLSATTDSEPGDEGTGRRRVQRMAALRPAVPDLETRGDWPLNPG
jgi:SAM-dependent methyltransferase